MSTELSRESTETSISLQLSIPGKERHLDIPCGFLCHNLTEDLGILIGRAFLKELESRPLARYGWCAMPMDGSLALVAVDISGRGQFVWDGCFLSSSCGTFDLELIPEFWRAFCRESHITIHGRLLAVDNSHHGAEALFKGIGRAMKQALASEEELQSTKGVLT